MLSAYASEIGHWPSSEFVSQEEKDDGQGRAANCRPVVEREMQ